MPPDSQHRRRFSALVGRWRRAERLTARVPPCARPQEGGCGPPRVWVRFQVRPRAAGKDTGWQGWPCGRAVRAARMPRPACALFSAADTDRRLPVGRQSPRLRLGLLPAALLAATTAPACHWLCVLVRCPGACPSIGGVNVAAGKPPPPVAPPPLPPLPLPLPLPPPAAAASPLA